MKFLVLILAASLFLAMAPASGADLSKLESLAGAEHHAFASDKVGRIFHLYVRTPDGYASADRPYPVVYVLDGGTLFPIFASLQMLLEVDEAAPKAIIVGIAYGGLDFESGNYRSTDYTEQTTDPDFPYWGGADAFRAALRDEIAPFIEETYRADPSRRILYGQSIGGQFVLHAARREPDLFWGLIAANPALHRNLDRFLSPAGVDAASPPNVFIARGEFDDRTYSDPMDQWVEHWSKVDSTGWRLKIDTLDGEGHSSIAPAAYKAGMAWLFSEREGR